MNDKRHKVELTLWLLAIVIAAILTSSDDWRQGHSPRRAANTAGSSSSLAR